LRPPTYNLKPKIVIAQIRDLNKTSQIAEVFGAADQVDDVERNFQPCRKSSGQIGPELGSGSVSIRSS
jgi:hypothetical protein